MATLDDIAAALYALKPDEFSSARDAEVRKARQAGDRELAKEVGQLRKPTQSAWLINLLWRDQHEIMEQLFELARELGRAQAEAAGSELRTLTQQRRQLESALLHRGVELATAAGVSVSDTTTREAQETLSAALATPEVADEVRSGRLVKPASYAGFGGLPSTSAKPRPASVTESKEPIDLRAAQRAREEREAAQRKVEEAHRAAEVANAALAQASGALAAAQSRASDLSQRLRDLREEVRRVDSDLDAARRESEAAQRTQDEAEAAHAAALKALAEAQRSL